MKKILVFGLVGIMLCCMMVPASYAFRVSPAKIEGVEIPKGKTGVVILNLTGSVINEQIKIFPTDIMVDRRGNLSFEKLKNWKYSCLSWIKLPEERILTLSKNRVKELEFKIKVPYTAKPGQYYACIMIEPTEFTPIERKIGGVTTVLNIKSRIAVPIIITVPGRIAKLDGKAISAEVKVKKEEVKVLATFKNEGNVIEEVRGKAQIVNKADRKVYDVVTLKALNPSAADGMGKVFPECLRDFEGVVKKPLPIGEYEARISFDYGIKFRQAKIRTEFAITEEIAVSQKELLVLAVEPELLELLMPRGGRIIKGLKVSNLDFEPLEVEVVSSKWIKIEPAKFRIPAGRSKNLRIVITIPQGEEPQRTGKIVFKPERGKPANVDVVIRCEEENK